MTSPPPTSPEPRLAVVGFGNMGAAVVSGAVASGVLAAGEILVVELEAAKRTAAADLGCRASADPRLTHDVPAVLLAVKPQSFSDLAPLLAPRTRRTVFVSVMAGLPGRRILAAMGLDGSQHAIVRAMPNMPCQRRQGMTALALSEGAFPGDEALAAQLFGSVGATVQVTEDLLDAATAVSGSGPAYLFLLAEAWQDAAVALGFDSATARLLVRQTIVGAAAMLADAAEDPARLRAAVTSKGGTTAAAIEVFERGDLRGLVCAALAAARDRGRELGG